MESAQKVRLVVGVIGLGVVAALPFARFHAPPLDRISTDDPRLSVVRDIGPRVTTEITASPAVGLQDHDPLANDPLLPATPVITRSQLDEHGLPPNLPGRYHSDFGEPNPKAVLPTTAPPVPREMTLSEPRVRPAPTQLERTHRVVDGDTLQRLARRYWSDESLADALYAANRAVLSAPDPLPLGVTLRIPSEPPQAAPAELPLASPTVVKQPSLPAPSDGPLTPIPPGAFSDRR